MRQSALVAADKCDMKLREKKSLFYSHENVYEYMSAMGKRPMKVRLAQRL